MPRRKIKRRPKFERGVYPQERKLLPIRHFGHQFIIVTEGPWEFMACTCGVESTRPSKDVLHTWWMHATESVKEENIASHELDVA